MNRRNFLMTPLAARAVPPGDGEANPLAGKAATGTDVRVAVLPVDTDRVMAPVDVRIYGHFLEHINHAVVDGLYAEQVRGCGFEGEDFKTYWEAQAERGAVELAETGFKNGSRSVRLSVQGGRAGIRQGRVFVDAGQTYDGSLWVKREQGAPALELRVSGSRGEPVATLKLEAGGSGWQEVPYRFTSPLRDRQAVLEVAATGNGTLLLDHISLMRADARKEGKLRPDLLKALGGLEPPFIRWPGGSFASTYKWRDGIGPQAERHYHPNMIWGGYSDYYGFGTEEFLGLCRRVKAEPLIVLAANSADPAAVQYAMDWVHYLNDAPDTAMGRLRAANGHAEPYGVRYFQIDNEPMNLGLNARDYAGLVNLYGARLRAICPQARIVACGQKRSNDMGWSETVIDLAGANFDILGVHNYEYDPANYESGLRRIRDAHRKLLDYVRNSAQPRIEVAVLEWNLSRAYDWRAGLHAAGSLMMYEELSPALSMTCPALLMRNTTDDPTWTSLIYHDPVSWFPGAAYVVEKLFREHYAEKRLASTSGTFRDLPDRRQFFDQVSTMRTDDWRAGEVDAIATRSSDGRRIVIKAVNYSAERRTLLVRLQGAGAPAKASVALRTVKAGLTEAASLERPDAIRPVSGRMEYSKDMAVELEPHSVVVAEIRAE